MRTIVLLSVLLLLLLPLAPVTASPDAPRRLVQVLPLAADATVAVPTPGPGDGIGPGSHLLITFDDDPGNLYGCTANFVWTGTNGKTYLGAAGHCYVPPGKVATAGPGADYAASRTHVRVCLSGCEFGGQTGFLLQGTTVALGTVAYGRQTQDGVDVGNDFGIVEIPTALLPNVRHAMPVWGAMSSVREVATGATLCHYGWAAGFGEAYPTAGRIGVGLLPPSGGAWNAALASFEGDSGSAIATCTVDASGAHNVAASGILTHLTALGIAGTSIAKAKTMAAQAGLTITPALGA